MKIEEYLAELESVLSAPRLGRYRVADVPDIDTVIEYLWNLALSEALYPTLGTLEVALRNAIHAGFSEVLGTEMWFYTDGLLEPRQLRDFANARLSLYQRKHRQPTPGQIVAELSFGFWTTLLSQPYHQYWAANKAHLLRQVFPNMAPPANWRHVVHGRCNAIRLLRNRVAHHEPVWRGMHVPGRGSVTLFALHAEIIEAIGWISPSVARSVAVCDRFDDVHTVGRARIEEGIMVMLAESAL